jgi:hypothetical protein
MKKLFLVLAFAFVGIFTANAQLWMGGAVGARITENVTAFTLSPEVGYSFTGTPWTVAAEVDYSFEKYKEGEAEHELILKPYVRYNLATIEKFGVFMDLTGDFGVVHKEGFAISLRPGVAWMATKHWTAAFRFAFMQYDHGFYHGDNGFYLDCAAVAPQFGLYYNF